MTSKQFKYNDETKLEDLPFKPDPPKPKSMRGPPPPSPSKFIKGEFRESDYESDYEGRIAPVWRPYDSDSDQPMHYKSVRPVLTPTGRRSCISDGTRSVTPPTAFDRPPQFDGPPRPKFEPIEKPIHSVKLGQILQPEPQPQVYRPTPVAARPVHTTRAVSADPPIKHVRYYTAIAGKPIHNANRFATETSNSMHMKESTETSHRIVNIQQTRRVIPLNNPPRTNQQYEPELEPFPYTADSYSYTNRQKVAPPPTPTKFVRGEFRESDYESEVESARIRPVWTPNQSDNEEPQYRRVNAPRPCRATSLPRTNTYGRVMTPMEFDTQPPYIIQTEQSITPTRSPVYHQHQTKTQTIDRYSTKKYQTVNNQTRDDIDLKPGSPPKYGYMNSAQNQIQSMNKTFKTKAQHFVQDLITDVKTVKQQKPILKKTLSDSGAAANDPQAYREESRVSQYGEYNLCFNF